MYLLKFDASGNQITQLPHTFVNLPYLAELNISGNELWELPEDFGRLAFSLVNLNVSNNKLDKLPASIGTLTRCKSMDFSNNKKGFQIDISRSESWTLHFGASGPDLLLKTIKDI